MRARRELALVSALTACAAFANVTVDAAARTVPQGVVPGDPAIGAYVIATDFSQSAFSAFKLDGTLDHSVAIGLTNSADIYGSLLAVAAPNSGIVFYNANATSDAPLPDGGNSTIQQASVSLVALGGDGSGHTLVFANSGGTTLFRYVWGGAALPQVTLPGVPRGLAWSNGTLYATISGSVVAVDSAGAVTTVISDHVGASEGLAVVTIAGIDYAFIGSSSDGFLYVHRLTAPAGFVDTVSLKYENATVYPKNLAANGSTLVVHDVTGVNYKLVAVSTLAAALLLNGTSDGGAGGGSGNDGGPTGGGGGSMSGPGGPLGNGPSGGNQEPLSLCGCSSPPWLIVPGLLAVLFARRRRS